MPYDPRMMQMAQMGVGMMGPSQQGARPKQWWEQGPPQDGQSANSPNQPPGLLQMMTNLGRMSRPQYDQAIKGGGAGGIPPGAAAQVSPWAFLGSMGMPGGPGWGGGGGGP